MLIRTGKNLVLVLVLTAGYTNVMAQSLNPVSVDATFNLTLNPGLDSTTIDSLAEGKAFVDLNYLDKVGGGIGGIVQSREYTQSNDISNQVLFANVWGSWFPSSLNGKVTTNFDYYKGNDAEYVESSVTTVVNDNPGQGQGQGQGGSVTTVTNTSYVESFTVINPSVSFLNTDKTFLIELGYAESEYESSEINVNKLKVKQWSPAIGFALNNNVDWVQIRYYDISLSEDIRTMGVDNVSSVSVSWTHWFPDGENSGLHSFYASILGGDRVYGVEQGVRKVFNISDVQSGSAVAGVTWKFSQAADMSLYAGYEQYEDVNNSLDYDNIFFDLSLVLHW